MKTPVLIVGLFALAACSPDSTDVEPLNITNAVGACDLPNGVCQVMTQDVCLSGGGTYRGDNTACTASDINTDGG